MNITVLGEEICTFTHFQQWVNKAKSWLGRIPRNEQMICLDKNGNVVTGGLDMMYCRDHDLFPVTAYLLTRSSKSITE